MKRIELLDQASDRGSFSEIGVNPTFGQAYFAAIRNGNETLDFNYVVWKSDVEPILADCRRFGITEFTISSTFSSLVEIIADFVERGCRLDGIVKVKAPYTDTVTGEKKVLPAFLLRVGQAVDHA